MWRHAILVLLALAGCGSTHWDPPQVEKFIRTDLARKGIQVASVTCPMNVKIAKGVVTHCTATLQDRNTVPFKVTQTNDTGRVRIRQTEWIAEQLQNGIQALLLQTRQITATATCPNHIEIVVGRRFECTATERSGRRVRILCINDTPSHVSFRLIGPSPVAGRGTPALR